MCVNRTETVTYVSAPAFLPDNWRLVRLGDVCTVHAGQHIMEADYNREGDGDGYLTGPADFGEMYPTVTRWTQSPKAWCEPGDVLVTVKGAGVGKANLAPNVRVAIGRQLMAVRPKPTLVDRLFIYYQVVHGLPALQSKALGSTVPGLSREDVASLPVLLPPLAEQHRMVAILETWDRAIVFTTQLIATKQEHKHVLVQQLLTGKRRFPAFRERWALATFGQVFSSKNARNTGSRIKTPITVGKYVIRPQSEHFNRVVASDNLENYNIIELGDFVYDPMSAYYGAFGRYELGEPGIVSPVYRVLHVNPGYDSDFMKHLIKSHHIAYQLTANSSQGNRHGKRRTIQEEAFDSISFAIPSIDEQRVIAEVLNACDRELALLARQLVLFKQQKLGLMQQLLTGKVRVTA